MEFCGPIAISVISPCASDPDRVRVRAELPVDVSELLPYLNAILPGAVYSPTLPSLTITRDVRLLTIYADHIMLDRAHSSTDAREVVDWVRDTLNDTHRRQPEITPVMTTIKRPGALEIYRLLPGLNCGRCGHPTCLAFAAGLLAGRDSLSGCEDLDPAAIDALTAAIGSA